MDEIISPFVKFLSNTIMVNIHSYPNFSMETILSTVICIVHCLLIFEVNSLYRRTNAKAAAKLRLRHCIKDEETCSYHTLSHYQTQILPQKIETTTTKQSFYLPYKHTTRKVSTTSNFGWVVSHGDSLVRHSFNERVEHLLSISPSEYVRKDKERKTREAGLRTCIQSLTSLLERALSENTEGLESLSKGTIQKSLNTIRESFETHMSKETYPLGPFTSASLQSLIANSINRRSLRNTLMPKLTDTNSTINRKFSEGDTKAEDDDEGDQQMEDSLIDLVENGREDSILNLVETKSSTNVSELLTDTLDEDEVDAIKGERQQQLCYV